MKTNSLLVGLCFLSVVAFGKTYTLKIDGGGPKGYHTVEYKDDSTKTLISCEGEGESLRPKVTANDGACAAATFFVNTEFEAALSKVKQGQLNSSFTATDQATRRVYVVSWKGKDVNHVTICIAPQDKKKS